MRPSAADARDAGHSLLTIARIDLRILIPAVAAGLACGLQVVTASISYPAVIFTGALEPYLGVGIAMALFGTTVLGLIVAVGSTYPAAVATSQIETAVVLGAMSAAIPAALGEQSADQVALATLLAAIVVSTLSLGLVLVVFGAFRLGNVIRYVPFPVIGAFLAYIAWLLLRGGITMMSGQPLSFQAAPLLLQPDTLLHWLPGTLLAIGLLALQMVRRHHLNATLMFVVAVAGFWLVAWLAGASASDLRSNGYLLTGIFQGQGWSPGAHFAAFGQVDWALLAQQLPQVVVIWLVAMITLLVSASSVEVATRSDFDLNRELKVTGLANLVSGLGGGLPGYLSVSASLLPHYLGSRSRLVGLIAAGICASVLLVGGPLLAYVPKLLLGLVLIYLALDIAAELAMDRWPKMPAADQGIMLLVLFSLIWLGFVQGLVIGIVAGLAVFAFNYARIDPVRASGTAARYASNVVRPPAHVRLLAERHDAIQVILIQGYLFFGKAYGLLQGVSALLALPRQVPLEYLILDFERVDGADSSTIISLVRLLEQAEQRNVTVLFAALPANVAASLRSAGLDRAGQPTLRAFHDLDHALEHAEDALLSAWRSDLAGGANPDNELERAFPDATMRREILAYGTRVQWRAGDYAMRQGEQSSEMYFIESGRLTARLERPDGSHVRLRTITPGTVIGEVACYLGLPRSASVVADLDSTALRITKDALRRMRSENAELAAAFHEFMARAAAERLAYNTGLLEDRIH